MSGHYISHARPLFMWNLTAEMPTLVSEFEIPKSKTAETLQKWKGRSNIQGGKHYLPKEKSVAFSSRNGLLIENWRATTDDAQPYLCSPFTVASLTLSKHSKMPLGPLFL